MMTLVRWVIGMCDAIADSDVDADADAVDPLVAAYRHDVHKLRARAHSHAVDWVDGVRVNESVPDGADGDAALLSRPRGDPEQTVDAYASWRRVSLLTGEVISSESGESLDELLVADDAEQLHATWVSATLPAGFNESPYYPYTSVKYHTLLAAVLLDNYRNGHEFGDLFLAVGAADTESVTPHRTVLSTGGVSLAVTGEPGDRPAARLGDVPARSFADTWARLPVLPFDVAGSRRWRVLDSQLRRIRSWSVALQFIEDYVAAFAPAQCAGHGRRGRRGGGEGR